MSLAVSLLGGCSTRGGDGATRWTEVPRSAFPGGTADRPPFETAVVAGSDGSPWLIGGVIPAAPSAAAFRIFSKPQVAIWVAPSPNGRWTLSSMRADPQRDGPNETIMYLTTGRTPDLAFGWRNSPTEGYPRPSAWDSQDRAGAVWTEIPEDREFFGGPDIVGFGGVASGPHGHFVGGTWTAPSGALVASVWSSPDGASWSRNAEDPSFARGPGETPFVQGIADSVGGLLMVGTADAPTRADPGAQHGLLWFSPDGRRWSIYDSAAIHRLLPDSQFGAVAATPKGWLVGGTSEQGGASRPLAWFLPAGGPAGPPVMLGGGSASVTVTGIAVGRSRAVLAAVTDGRVDLWTAPVLGGVPGRWSALKAPPTSVPELQRAGVSISPSAIAVDLVGKSASQVWWAPLGAGP